MRKVIALILALLCLTAWTAAEDAGLPEGEERTLSWFWYTYGGYTIGHSYEVFQLGEDWYLCVDEAPSREIDADVTESLTRIILKYDLTGWDGFHGSDPYVLDGEGFSMEIALSDGTDVSASGSNHFPEHYFDASYEIRELLDGAASGRIRDAAGIYRYEGEGFGGDFTMTIARDGTYSFYEGPLSSYMGGGTWYISGSRMYMTEENGLNLYFTMIPVEDALIFSANGYTDNFLYVQVPDGGRFVRDETEPYGTTARLALDSFDGGGPTYRIEVGDRSLLRYSAEIRYRDENHEELDGAGYEVVYEFVGMKPGTTRVIVRSESPIAGNEERTFTAVIDGNLNVTITEEE